MAPYTRLPSSHPRWVVRQRVVPAASAPSATSSLAARSLEDVREPRPLDLGGIHTARQTHPEHDVLASGLFFREELDRPRHRQRRAQVRGQRRLAGGAHPRGRRVRRRRSGQPSPSATRANSGYGSIDEACGPTPRYAPPVQYTML